MCLIATKMLLSLQSTNEDYSTIRANINIPWECKYVKYWLSSVNFNANICMCTSNDSIKLHRHNNVNDTDTITFEDETLLTENKLLDYLNLDGNNILVQFDVNDSGKIVMTPLSGDIVFDYIPQHTRMITGLMDLEIGKVYNTNEDYTFDMPIRDYANKLYIISKQGNAVHTNVGKQEYTPSILASIDTVIRNGKPVIVNFETYGKPIKTTANIDSFKYLELQLVDMMLTPVHLLSPMFITMKVKPCKTPQVILKP